MDEKPELVIFGQNIIGGVQSYYYNLLSHDDRNDFDKLWILTDSSRSVDTRLKQSFGVCSEVIFTYDEEPYHELAPRLQKLISNRPGVVMANHELELVACYNYRRRNKTLVFVCHDELYFENALKYEFLIDVYIAHNPYFYDELKKRLPSVRSIDVYYLPYGIKPALKPREKNQNGILKILFIARLTEKKGVFDLKKIDSQLLRLGVKVEWTIVGDGPAKDKLIDDLRDRSNFTFLSPLRNEDILDIATKNDIYLLPSYLDGLPVALLEAMSAGLVPIVSRFNPGIDSVIEAHHGFIVPVGDVVGFAEKIKYLNEHRNDLELKSENARLKILADYEVKSRARNYYDLLVQFKKLKKPMMLRRMRYNGTWDYPWIPQFVRELFRLIK